MPEEKMSHILQKQAAIDFAPEPVDTWLLFFFWYLCSHLLVIDSLPRFIPFQYGACLRRFGCGPEQF